MLNFAFLAVSPEKDTWTATSSGQRNNYAPDTVIDGIIGTNSPGTFFVSDGLSWVQLDLGDDLEVVVLSVTIVPRHDCCIDRMEHLQVRVGFQRYSFCQ